MPHILKTGVGLWGLSFIVERERAQTISKGPKVFVKWEKRWRYTDNQDVGLEAAII